jgi:hypothetical protein
MTSMDLVSVFLRLITTSVSHLNPVQIATIKNTTKTNVGKDSGKKELLVGM